MKNHTKLLLLAGVLVLPTVVAYLAFIKFDWRPSAQKNYGDLLSLTRLQGGAGTWGDGAASGFERARGKWVLAYVGPSACDDSCARSLFYMRQARILQDGERHRVDLVWVLTDAGTIDGTMLQAVPGLKVWRPADAAFVRQFPRKAAKARYIYLLDPLGNLILRFPDQPDARRMTKDIKLLLKASQIG